jgi:hypothetical protein
MFFDSPEQYERHFHATVDQESKEKWLDKFNKEQEKIKNDEKKAVEAKKAEAKAAEAKAAEAKAAEAKAAEAKKAEEVNATTKENADKNNPNNFIIKNELLKQSIDDIGGITDDVQKTIISKINRKDNTMQINKLADYIKKYNDNRDDKQAKIDVDRQARSTLNNVKSTIDGISSKIKIGDLDPDKKSQEESTLATYRYILQVVENLIKKIEDEDIRKNIKGGKRLRKKTRRNKRQNQRRKTMRRRK